MTRIGEEVGTELDQLNVDPKATKKAAPKKAVTKKATAKKATAKKKTAAKKTTAKKATTKKATAKKTTTKKVVAKKTASKKTAVKKEPKNEDPKVEEIVETSAVAEEVTEETTEDNPNTEAAPIIDDENVATGEDMFANPVVPKQPLKSNVGTFSMPEDEDNVDTPTLAISPEEQARRDAKASKRRAHLRRYEKLKKLGFSDEGIRWLLDWAFHKDNIHLIQSFMPSAIDRIANRAKSYMEDAILRHKEGTLGETFPVKLPPAELKLLNDWFKYHNIQTTATVVSEMKVGSLGSMFTDEFAKFGM